MNRLELDLFGFGMTALHRIGLAGLWMTLRRFEDEGIQLPEGEWLLENQRIVLRWSESGPKRFLESLFEQAFRVDDNGLIWFSALGEPMQHPDAGVVLHEAVLGTFLQHGRTRKAEPKNKTTGCLAIEMDDNVYQYQYQKVYSYSHQKGVEELVNAAGKLKDGSVKGWNFPGGTVRHNAFGVTGLSEPPERMLPLLFAPVGAIYFRIRKYTSGRRPQFALILPDIDDLPSYARVRWSLQRARLPELLVSGTAEAGWRVLALIEADGLLTRLRSPACRIVSFGTVPWASQQKTRVEIFSVRMGVRQSLRTYRVCRQYLPNRLVKAASGATFWGVPVTPELVASNLALGRDWYNGFTQLMSDQETRDRIRYERRGLSKMVEEPLFSRQAEIIFVTACHEAWRRRLGQLGERSKRENASFQNLVRREYERWRTSLVRCKNVASLRETVMDLWSRSGSLAALRSDWQQVLPLFSDQEWRLARDLALLALASYAPQSRDEEAALDGTEDTSLQEGASA